MKIFPFFFYTKLKNIYTHSELIFPSSTSLTTFLIAFVISYLEVYEKQIFKINLHLF